MATWMWQVLAALAVATVFAFAVAQAQATAPGVRDARQVLAGSVRSAEATTNSATPDAMRWPPSLTPNDAAALRVTSGGGSCSAALTSRTSRRRPRQ